MDGDHLRKAYKDHISNYWEWDQRTHAAHYVLFPQNMGPSLSIDETSLSQGELYTVVTNKDAKGRKGSLVALIEGTNSEGVSAILSMIDESKRLEVKEVSMDLSPTMQRIVKRCFDNATIVADRFHVQQLMSEAISELRIEHRWDAIDLDNKERALAKEEGQKYVPYTFRNGDTRKQLLARSRYVLMKNYTKWTEDQQLRAAILFEEYPDIAAAYEMSMRLTAIYNKHSEKSAARLNLARWCNDLEKLGTKHFNIVKDTIYQNYEIILNYFINRTTNASAESFNAKVKAFRSQFRGVSDIPFFVFRLVTLLA